MKAKMNIETNRTNLVQRETRIHAIRYDFDLGMEAGITGIRCIWRWVVALVNGGWKESELV